MRQLSAGHIARRKGRSSATRSLVFIFSILIAALPLSAEEKELIETSENLSLVETNPGEYLVEITSPLSPNKTHTYRLVSTTPPPSTAPDPQDAAQAPVTIPIPAQRIVSLSTTYIGPIEAIGALDLLVAIDNADYIYSASVRALVESGTIVETGNIENLDLEKIIAAKPDLILLTQINPGQDAVIRRFQQLGIPVLITAAWKETTPLGRSEWIKLFGIITGKKEEAFEHFEQTRTRYDALRLLLEGASPQPSQVLLSAPYGGIWYMPGGESYTSTFLRDAGAVSLWDENRTTGSFPVDLESALTRGLSADFWMNPGQYKTLAELKAADPRFAILPAYRNDKVYNRTRRVGESGGNDFWESGSTYPDKILADLIAIFHPELLPDHPLYYYEKLK